jgi:polyhydroxyalkanoate synthesis repressor PhaR
VKPPSSSERSRRIIKRYSNRKLYDTRESRYVTLLQIAGMVRAGEDVQIIDNASKEDKTEVTLALIISEELKSQPRSVPLGTLRDLIHQRGEKLLTQLREGPIARLIPGGPLDEKKEELMPDSQDSSAKSSVDGVEPRPDASSGTVGQGGATGNTDASGRNEGSQFEHWRHTVDERIRMILPSFGGYRDLQAKVEQLSRKVADLEAELARRKP